MMKALIHISEKKQAHRVIKVLETFKLTAKVVSWRVSKEDENGIIDVRSPNLGLYVPEDQLDALTMRLGMMGVEILLLKHDPVAIHAIDPRRFTDKYVVVSHMPPKPQAIGIVDTDNSEFVTLMDFSALADTERQLAEEEAGRCLQFMANELNRLHSEIQALLAVGPAQFN